MAFGGVWKESLTELSGGQRSLLALSLILALCRWVFALHPSMQPVWAWEASCTQPLSVWGLLSIPEPLLRA